MSNAQEATGAEIVALYLAGECRWALYSTQQITDAMAYASRTDLNKVVRVIARVLDARGALPDRDKFLL